MKRCLIRIACVLACAAVLLSCSKVERELLPSRRVVLLYGAAFSNLSTDIDKNFNDFCKGELPYVGSEDVLLVYNHIPSKYGVYTPTEPVLYRAYKGQDNIIRKDTLIVYPSSDISGSPEVLSKVLTDVKDMFPARSYGLLFSSHGKGWLPKGYSEGSGISLFSVKDPLPWHPPTKDLGIEKVEGSGIEIADLPGAIPMHLDFIIMDACLMGCVEVAYELRDKCDILIFSPTEILSSGMNYYSMPRQLLNIPVPDLTGLSKDYYEMYQAQSGLYKSATITMVDCSKTQALADAVAEIVGAHRDGISSADRSEVQAYFYASSSIELHKFFDLRDILVKAGATDSELERLDKALNECIIYTAATEKFFELELKSVCGLSMYLPEDDDTELNDFYKTLSWNKAIGLIQ